MNSNIDIVHQHLPGATAKLRKVETVEGKKFWALLSRFTSSPSQVRFGYPNSKPSVKNCAVQSRVVLDIPTHMHQTTEEKTAPRLFRLTFFESCAGRSLACFTLTQPTGKTPCVLGDTARLPLLEIPTQKHVVHSQHISGASRICKLPSSCASVSLPIPDVVST